VTAWIATRPRRNPSAPLTPFAMPQYRPAAEAETKRLDAEAEVSAAEVRRDIQRASNYVLGVVLFAVSLFFAGMSTKLGSPASRRVLVAVGYAVFLGALVWIATSPVSLAV
jgi:predicted phage tail protein